MTTTFIDFICPNCGRIDENTIEVVDDNELKHYLKHPPSQLCLKCQLFSETSREEEAK